MPRAGRRGREQSNHPRVVVLAGPNGAGKSTAAPTLLRGALRVTEFVNADDIARGLSAFHPDSVALSAGRIMLRRLDELAAQRVSFAFETTLASRHFAAWIAKLKAAGYEFHLLFLWLPNADTAVLRVATRVHLGGHGVPEATVRRRYNRGLFNFFELLQPLATTWRLFDSSGRATPSLIARGRGRRVTRVSDRAKWNAIRKAISHAQP